MSNISYFSIRTLILMKLKIFIKEYAYSIIAPLISSVIFIIILKTISEIYSLRVNNTTFMNFIVPGIIMMVVIQETFSNISETIIHMKQEGTFKDILMAPISREEIAISFLISILFIGIIVAIINLIVISIFIDIHLYSLWRFILYLSLSSILFGSFGAIIGFISYTWDSQQGFFNFLIAPISLLSGTFFSVDIIEKSWQGFFLANPFYHLVSNLRQSFEIDQSYSFKIDTILVFLVFVIVYFTLYILRKGYRVIE